MADEPQAPMAMDTVQELAQLNAQLAALNAAGDAERFHEYKRLGGDDARILLYDRIATLTTRRPTAADAAPDRAPQRTVLEGLMAAHEIPRDSQDARRIQRLGQSVPEPAHGELFNFAFHEYPAILAEMTAAASPLRFEETETALRAEWGRDYEERLAWAAAAWDHLPREEQEDVNRRGGRLHPKTIKALSRMGARILGAEGHPMTPQGEQWILARGTEGHEERERAKAEAAEQDRQARERFGYGQGR